MKVLVTGGAGYIGSHAVEELIAQGYQVVVIDNLTTGFQSNVHPEAKYYEVDLRNETALYDVFATEKNIGAIMHFAGAIVVSESVAEPLKYYDNNVHAVQVLLSVARAFKIKYFIFSSTAAVYGEPVQIPIKESDPKEPINPYGSSKLAAEWLVQAWAEAYKSHYVIFRYFNVAGAHENGLIGIKNQHLSHLVPVILDAALKNQQFLIYGQDYPTKDGTCIRDFIHVVDLVKAHILGLEWALKNQQSEIFNLGSATGYSVWEVYQTAQEVLNQNIKHLGVKRRPGDPTILLANVEKAKAILNWVPNKTLAEIIASEWNFRKQWMAKEAN